MSKNAESDAALLTLYSIGHSNHPLGTFLALLEAHAVRGIADVRAFPSSRRWPHFNRAPLTTALAARGIHYEWLPALGGRRAGRAQSPHTAWTVAAFRNYADHAESTEFATGFEHLLAAARQRRTAFMCAEALYWQCHRRLIADRLVLLGHRVLHITAGARLAEHHLPGFARVIGGRLIYDRGTQLEMARDVSRRESKLEK
jgi:uncharacterized protein (DUF488 family)